MDTGLSEVCGMNHVVTLHPNTVCAVSNEQYCIL